MRFFSLGISKRLRLSSYRQKRRAVNVTVVIGTILGISLMQSNDTEGVAIQITLERRRIL
jgi:hypothetical protein